MRYPALMSYSIRATLYLHLINVHVSHTFLSQKHPVDDKSVTKRCRHSITHQKNITKWIFERSVFIETAITSFWRNLHHWHFGNFFSSQWRQFRHNNSISVSELALRTPQPEIYSGEWERIMIFGYCRCLRVCVCVRVSVNHEFVRAITHQPFKLGSLNLDHRCKRPWLRALLFCGMIDRDLQGQIKLQSQNLPHFEFVHAITHHQLKLQFPHLEQKCILALFRSLPILGLIEIDLQFNF